MLVVFTCHRVWKLRFCRVILEETSDVILSLLKIWTWNEDVWFRKLVCALSRALITCRKITREWRVFSRNYVNSISESQSSPDRDERLLNRTIWNTAATKERQIASGGSIVAALTFIASILSFLVWFGVSRTLGQSALVPATRSQ